MHGGAGVLVHIQLGERKSRRLARMRFSYKPLPHPIQVLPRFNSPFTKGHRKASRFDSASATTLKAHVQTKHKHLRTPQHTRKPKEHDSLHGKTLVSVRMERPRLCELFGLLATLRDSSAKHSRLPAPARGAPASLDPDHSSDFSGTMKATQPSSTAMSYKFGRGFRNLMHSIRCGHSTTPASPVATSPTLVPSDFDTSKLDAKPSKTCQKKFRRAFRKALRMLIPKNSKSKHVATSSKAAPPENPAQPSISARIAAWSGEVNFGPVLKIPDSAVVELALDLASTSSHIPKNILADGSDIRVIAKARGQNNQVFIVQYREDLKICVRVPACGWEGAWTDKDAEALHTQVRTMQYIKRNTKCPIPEIVHYDTTFNNAISAPHVVMAYVEGRPVEDMWYDESGPLPLEEKRQNILRSLAHGVAELRSLNFDKMGALTFTSDTDENPVPGKFHVLNFGASRTPSFMEFAEEVDREPLTSSETYLRNRLEDWKHELTESESNPRSGVFRRPEDQGIYRFFSMLIEEMPIPKEGEEKFVLAPPDFDWQNILADGYGNVTAILDWDRVETTAGWLGWAAFPEFLVWDWEPEGYYVWPHWNPNTMSPAQYDKYRDDYAHYIKEACPEGEDGGNTAKSHIYNQLTLSIGFTSRMEGILERILATAIPRVDAKLMRQYVGEKCLTPAQEAEIRQAFRKLMS